MQAHSIARLHWAVPFWRILLLALLCAGPLGCRTFDHYDPSVEQPVPAQLTPPRELELTSHPDYLIEPPDLLQIEVLNMIPKPPYRVDVYDVLQIEVIGTLLDQPIAGYYLVEAEGEVNLGPAYGKVRVAGLTIEQADQAIGDQLRRILRQPEVSVQLARASGLQPISGIYLVGPDGTLNLRYYGQVHVAGRTPTEVERILQRHLAGMLDSPEVAVDVAQSNSKVYYVVTEGLGNADNVRRLPVTGNETVLDALAEVGGVSQISSDQIWVARPAGEGQNCEQILPVDYEAIASGASTATNYQLLPGDRVYVAANGSQETTEMLARVFGPAQEAGGFVSLMGRTVRDIQRLGRRSLQFRRFRRF